MSAKKSVFLVSSTVDWIAATTAKPLHGENPQWSESINTIFWQFKLLLKDSLPNLNSNEWIALIKVYKDQRFPAHGVGPARKFPHFPVRTLPRIANDMMNAVGAINLESISDKSYAQLVVKMHGMTPLEQLAILYFIQIFWQSDWTAPDWENNWACIEAAIRQLF